LTVHQKFR